MPAQPGKVALQRRARYHEQKGRLGHACNRQVGFNAAAVIEHLCVDDPAWRDVDVIGTQALQECSRAASLDADLAE